MTRTLVILRHAKAVRPDTRADEDRPLTDRGRVDAAAAGAWLVERELTPDVVLCSTSTRTRQTWQSVAAVLGGSPPVRYDEAIYLASARSLFAVVRSAPAEAGTALLIGHNPGVTLLSAALDPEADHGGGLRTAGIAVHTWDGAWVDCGLEPASLAFTHTPRASAS